MKALTVLSPGHAEYCEVPKPIATGDMMVIKVVRVGICATDFGIFTGESSFVKDGSIVYPVRFGHEWTGIVESVGENVKDFKSGDRVYADNAVSCGTCPACLEKRYNDCPSIRSVGTVNIWDGCFAEYMLMPERHVYHLPDNLSFDEGALLEPASIALDAFRGFDVNANQTIAVVGTGAIGLSAAWLAKYFGAGQVIMVGRENQKLSVAKEVGADIVINNREVDMVEAILNATDGRGADMIIETSGSPAAFFASARATARFGRLSIASFYEQNLNDVPLDSMMLNCLQICGVAGGFGNPKKVCDIMEANPVKLSPIISHYIPFAECLDFLENEEKYHRAKIKAMVTFDEGGSLS